MKRFFFFSSLQSRTEERTPAVIAGDGLVLLATLIGTVLFSIETYDLGIPRSYALNWCVFFAVLFLVVFFLSRRLRLVMLLLLGEACALLVWQRWEDVIAGGLVLGSRWADTLTEATGFPGTISFTLPEIYTPELTQRAAEWCVGLAIFLLALMLSWVVIRLRWFWALFFFTAPWIIPALLAEIALYWFGLFLVVSGWMACLLSRQSTLRLISLSVSALTLALLFLMVPEEGYTPPVWTGTARTALIELGNQFQSVFSESIAEMGGEEMDPERELLSMAGPRQYSEKTILEVESDTHGTLYLRGSSYAVYDGMTWEGLSEEEEREQNDWIADGGSALWFPSMGRTDEQPRFATVSYVNEPGDLVYYPYHPVEMPDSMRESVTIKDDTIWMESPLWEYTMHFLPLEEQPVRSTLSGSAVQTEETYRTFVYDHYLDVPQETEEYLQTWKNRTEGLAGNMDTERGGDYSRQLSAADQIVELLALTTEYDLDTPYTPSDSDFTIHFLDVSRRGYCIHYATAAALLLRMEGIPTRYVSGYLTQIPESGITAVPDSAAHAWVEIYLDGYGWYPIEATPPGAVGEETLETETPSEEVPEQDEALPSEETSEQEPASLEDTPSNEAVGEETIPSEDNQDISTREVSSSSGLWILIVLLSILSLIRFYRSFRWHRLFTRPDNNAAVIDVWGWFQQLIRWGGKLEKDVEMLAQKARFSQHTLTEAEREMALRQLIDEISRCKMALPRWKQPLFAFQFQFKAQILNRKDIP